MQTMFTKTQGAFLASPAAPKTQRKAVVVRAGQYDEELIQTAVSGAGWEAVGVGAAGGWAALTPLHQRGGSLRPAGVSCLLAR